MIGPTCIVVPAGDFANAVADLEEPEPVASVPFLALDPDASFSLAASLVKVLKRKPHRFRGMPARSRAPRGRAPLVRSRNCPDLHRVVCRAELGTHSKRGIKDCGAAAPFSVRCLLLSAALREAAKGLDQTTNT